MNGIRFFRVKLLVPTNHEHNIGGRTVRSETTLFLRQDPHVLAVLAEAASDDRQQYLAGVRYQRNTPVVAALCPILLFAEYHDDGMFPLLRHLPPLQIETTVLSSLRRRAGSPLKVVLNSSTETPSVRQPFRSPTSGRRLSAPVSWAELVAACSRATGQDLRRCLGRASMTWR